MIKTFSTIKKAFYLFLLGLLLSIISFVPEGKTQVAKAATVVSPVASGSYTGNATSGRHINVGFRPKAVFIGGTYLPNIWTTETMQASGNISLSIACGGGPSTYCNYSSSNLVPNAIIGLDSTGFTLGNNNYINQSGLTFSYMAFADIGNLGFSVGSYIGDGTENRKIDLPFNPAIVATQGESNETRFGEWKTLSHPANSDDWFSGALSGVISIGTLTTNGFYVNKDPYSSSSQSSNRAGEKYYYFAYAKIPGFTTDGVLSSSKIGTTGFQPEVVWVSTYKSMNEDFFVTRDTVARGLPGQWFEYDWVHTPSYPYPTEEGVNEVSINSTGFSVDWGDYYFAWAKTPPPFCTSFTATAPPVGGGDVTFNWDTWYTANASLDGVDVSSSLPSGNAIKQVFSDTTFTLSLTGPGGTGTCSVNVSVTPLPPSSIVANISPSDQAIDAGQEATYTVSVSSPDGFTGDIDLECNINDPAVTNIQGCPATLNIPANSSAQWKVTSNVAATYSNVLSARGVAGAISSPWASASLNVTLGSFTLSGSHSCTGPKIDLSWSASTGAASYEIVRGAYPPITVGPSVTSYSDTYPFTPGENLSYKIVAKKPGVSDRESNSINITVPSCGGSPTTSRKVKVIIKWDEFSIEREHVMETSLHDIK